MPKLCSEKIGVGVAIEIGIETAPAGFLSKLSGYIDPDTESDTDETFIIMEGTLVMNFRDGNVELHAGELIVIPKGVEHKPASPEGYQALLIEPEGVPNTGDVKNEMSIDKIEWV